ncbi:methyl-accepting chemotaxis protein [Pacificoceanicola onchidii]|uniref:methyl-accepting chemotaxis protein n=1 Tax=Pacificoceanicola onchidii TaxID=2562685 RepID=UPI0010A59469|nr:globin-coupled sensor protein [Pacificoceanicola onchidii]
MTMKPEGIIRQYALDGENGEALRRVAGIVEDHIDDVLTSFYDRAQKNAEASSFFSGPEQMARARAAQKIHWLQLFAGTFDDAYFASVNRIGATHARIKLPIHTYMSAYARAASDILDVVVQKSSGRFGISARARAQISAANRAFTMDMAQVIEVYERLVQEEQARAFSYLDTAIGTMANGDLTHRIPAPSPDGFPESFSDVREHLNSAVGNLSGTLRRIGSRTTDLASSAIDIGGGIDDLARRTENQASALEETAAAMEELSNSVREATTATDSAKTVAEEAQQELEDGISLIRDTSDAMTRIQASSDRISQIIGVIDDVSFQTNLLALNAGVEAARAGNAGRGFAVVANEVRTLATSTAEAAGEIKKLINESVDEIESGAKLAENVAQAFSQIMERFSKVSDLTAMVASGAKEQSRAVVEVNTSIAQIDQITQHNNAMVEETTAATQVMSGCAAEVQDMLAQLRFSKEEHEVALRPADQAVVSARVA